MLPSIQWSVGNDEGAKNRNSDRPPYIVSDISGKLRFFPSYLKNKKFFLFCLHIILNFISFKKIFFS
uniref:Uncharacterized protein n=1 Tax=Meloidogyne enterolobii TaxID=390850 RepID=A0A6V7VQT4_MELEN|nr:unnamed protein product [Meloidogyne enterolobii]